LLAKRLNGVGIELAPERINVAKLTQAGTGSKLAALSSSTPEGIFEGGEIYDPPALGAETNQHWLKTNQSAACWPLLYLGNNHSPSYSLTR